VDCVFVWESELSYSNATVLICFFFQANESQKLSQANGKRLFQGACAACHIEGTGPTLFGVRPSLRVNTNMHSDTPDNLLHENGRPSGRERA
ncbi:hypothetical protein DTX79_03040, partial [Bacilli bacterium]